MIVRRLRVIICKVWELFGKSARLAEEILDLDSKSLVEQGQEAGVIVGPEMDAGIFDGLADVACDCGREKIRHCP